MTLSFVISAYGLRTMYAIDSVIGVLVLEVYTFTNQQLRFIMATHLLKYDRIKGSPKNLSHTGFKDKIFPIRKIEIGSVFFGITLFSIFVGLSVTTNIFYSAFG